MLLHCFCKKYHAILFAIIAFGCATKEVNQGPVACDSNNGKVACPNLPDGRKTGCFPGRGLGGKDFCAPLCAPGVNPPDVQCTETQHALSSCNPAVADAGCPKGQSCLRTNFLNDVGVCVTAPVCVEANDCTDPEFPVCGALLLPFVFTKANWKTSNTQCVQYGCETQGFTCPSGYTCFGSVANVNSFESNLCLPNCDENNLCPPGSACLRRVSGPAAPRSCIPGIIGTRCTDDRQCLMGPCVDTGNGFGVCAPHCEENSDCSAYDKQVSAVCGSTAAGEKHCVYPDALDGSNCLVEQDCLPGFFCHHYRQWSDDRIEGQCRRRCDVAEDNACAPVLGIPFTCLAGGGDAGCNSGRFSLPCRNDSDCIEDMSCLAAPVAGIDGEIETKNICTYTCNTDTDCDAHRFSDKLGICEGGVCAPRRSLGRVCTGNRDCRSDSCALSMTPGEAVANIRRCVPVKK